MNGKQSAVLWIGLILIMLNWLRQWGTIKSVLFGGSGSNNSPGLFTISNPGAIATPTKQQVQA